VRATWVRETSKKEGGEAKVETNVDLLIILNAASGKAPKDRFRGTK
jgi:hypothetical protein